MEITRDKISSVDPVKLSIASPAEQLPIYVLVKIFQSFAFSPSDLCSTFNLVCKKWKKAAEHSVLWKPFVAERFPDCYKKSFFCTNQADYRAIYRHNILIHQSIKKDYYSNFCLNERIHFPLKIDGGHLVTESGIWDLESGEKVKSFTFEGSLLGSQIEGRNVYNLSHNILYVHDIDSGATREIGIKIENNTCEMCPVSFAVQENLCYIRYLEEDRELFPKDLVHIFDLQTGNAIDNFELDYENIDNDPMDEVFKMAFLGDKLIIGSTTEEGFKIWDTKNKNLERFIVKDPHSFLIFEDNLFIKHKTRSLQVWSIDDLTNPIKHFDFIFECPDEEVFSFIRVHDGKLFCCTSTPNSNLFQRSSLGIIDLKTNALVHVIHTTGYLISTLFEEDRLITITAENSDEVDNLDTHTHNIRHFQIDERKNANRKRTIEL